MDYSSSHSKGGLIGYPIPITECPIDCCSMTDFMDHSKVQLTGLFQIHSKQKLMYHLFLILVNRRTLESCIDKVNCVSYHTGALYVLHVSLFENGLLHMQTEKVKFRHFY